ncbi:MAG: DNA helicase UvrD [Chitinophagaceae bacterium BSSC1]|nr:MAG: DNA helicase UvrD [Chitinophagaceae bacterium BSSC1]
MANQEEQKARFLEVYTGLNKEQKKAVDTIEGPVMVIAGPGTGKTQILGARIGKILLDTDAQPDNILCLTYTDAGAVAMRKRLLGFIGADAYKVHIYTFHAFCNNIIQDNLSLFEKTSLDPVSDLERIDLFKQLIDSFPKNHVLKRYRGDVYYEIGNLQNLFSNMKKEGWTPSHINERIDAYLSEIETRDEFVYKRAYKQFKAGDKKENKIAEERERMEKLRAAVNEFDRFQLLMRNRNRYDFDDMINWVIKAFEEHPNLLMRYQEQFLYILVDEYQDTSGTQNKIVELLINYWEQPNVFVVGDDDQSIYRFQGANVENMTALAKRYEQDLVKVVLTNNYRSTQPILDIAKTLIDRNQERLIKQMPGLSKDLISSNGKLTGITDPPKIKEYESMRQEMIGICLEVEALLARGMAPGKIGIIYKENKYGEALAQFFKEKQIPVYSKRNLNLLEIPLAQKIILFLKYLAAEWDTAFGGEEMLFQILHFNWFGIPAMEIAEITAKVADLKYGANKTYLRKQIREKANAPAADLFSPAPAKGFALVSIAIENLIAAIANSSLINLVEQVIQQTKVLGWIMQSPDKHWHLQVLSGLFEFIKEEARRNPNLSLEQLVNIFSLMEKEDLALPLVQVSGTEKGVNLMTAHGSKGLEFEAVFFAGCNASNWEKKRKPGGGYQLPDTMFSTAPVHSEEEELRRLFYVALTRAELQLQISFSRFKNDGKPLEPTMFLAEILEQHSLGIQPIALSQEALSEFALLDFEAELAPEIAKMEADFVSRMLEKFVMNVTALNNYLKCPLQFYYQNLVRVPSGKSEATEFGSAVHYALEKLFSKMQEQDKFPELRVFIDDFEWYMHRHRENFTKEEFNRRMEQGQIVLTEYYQNYINTWNKVVAVERSIRNVVVEGVPLKGKLDKLEFDGTNVNVVDYKTGDLEKARKKLLAPDEKEPNGGDYWRQAVFYKILVDHYDQKNWKVVSTEFDFIEPDKKKQFKKEKIVISPADMTTVTQQIKTVWKKIQDRELYTGCGKSDCHWCNFVKENDMAIALHELTEPDDETTE